MSLRQKVSDALLIISAKRLPKKQGPTSKKGNEGSAKHQVKDNFKEKGGFGASLGWPGGDSIDSHEIPRAKHKKVAKNIMRSH